MSIADKYAILESQIKEREELPEPAYVPLLDEVEQEFRLANQKRKRYHGLFKKEKNHG